MAHSGGRVEPRHPDPVFPVAHEYGAGGLLFRAAGGAGNAGSRTALRHFGVRVFLYAVRTRRRRLALHPDIVSGRRRFRSVRMRRLLLPVFASNWLWTAVRLARQRRLSARAGYFL